MDAAEKGKLTQTLNLHELEGKINAAKCTCSLCFVSNNGPVKVYSQDKMTDRKPHQDKSYVTVKVLHVLAVTYACHT